MNGNPNVNRGPWCVICGFEMSRPNHRFQARVTEGGGFEARRYHGGTLDDDFSPLCGEGCLSKALSEWSAPPRPAAKPAERARKATAVAAAVAMEPALNPA